MSSIASGIYHSEFCEICRKAVEMVQDLGNAKSAVRHESLEYEFASWSALLDSSTGCGLCRMVVGTIQHQASLGILTMAAIESDGRIIFEYCSPDDHIILFVWHGERLLTSVRSFIGPPHEEVEQLGDLQEIDGYLEDPSVSELLPARHSIDKVARNARRLLNLCNEGHELCK